MRTSCCSCVGDACRSATIGYLCCVEHSSLISWFFFFFSSRRRHTRLQGDWSSDVCSSDLAVPAFPRLSRAPALFQPAIPSAWPGQTSRGPLVRSCRPPSVLPLPADPFVTIRRRPAVGPPRFARSLFARACQPPRALSAHYRSPPTFSPFPHPRIPFRVYPPAVLCAQPRCSRELPASHFAAPHPSIRCAPLLGSLLASASRLGLFSHRRIPQAIRSSAAFSPRRTCLPAFSVARCHSSSMPSAGLLSATAPLRRAARGSRLSLFPCAANRAHHP